MQFLRFIIVGGTAFVLDSSLTLILMQLNIAPWLARIPAIFLAILYTWQANRRFTYRVAKSASAREGLRYGVVALSMATMNYLAYFILILNYVNPLYAIIMATSMQAIVGFYIYRYYVFEKIQ